MTFRRPLYRIEAETIARGPAGARSDGRAAAPAAAAEPPRLRAELRAVRASVAALRSQISAPSPNGGLNGGGPDSGDLDAVLTATERATSAILEAAEEIEAAAIRLRQEKVLRGLPTRETGVILGRVLAIYEACNFQDLTGQRLGKVGSALRALESRLDNALAGDGGPHAPEPGLPSDGAASSPLPAGADRVTQTDIDALFR